jgi:hypothetical protein
MEEARGSLVGWGTTQKAAGWIPDEVTWFFQFAWSFQPHCGRHGVDSVLNRN